MGGEFLRRPRQSRIYWRGKFLDYPLRGPDVMRKLGPVELTRSLLSYVWAAITPKGPEENLEQWVSNRFGKRLFEHFFKSYTEKVWGVPTTEVRAEWAAQRIKGLSFFSAAKAAFFGNRGNIKTLISEFNYPRYGPGQMWERMTDGDRAPGRRGQPLRAGAADPRSRRAGCGGAHAPSARSAPPRDLLAAAALDRRDLRAARRPPRSRAPPAGCATATSSPSRW